MLRPFAPFTPAQMTARAARRWDRHVARACGLVTHWALVCAARWPERRAEQLAWARVTLEARRAARLAQVQA